MNDSLPGDAFSQFVIKPWIPADMNHLDVTTRSIYGNIRCHYERGVDNEMNYTFEIPANSQANIVLPCLNHQSVFENGKDVKNGEKGVVSVEYKDGKAYLKMGSGNYTLQIKKKEATSSSLSSIRRSSMVTITSFSTFAPSSSATSEAVSKSIS